MKQFNYQSSSNLDRYVKESLDGITYEDIIDMVADDQSEAMDILKLSKEQLLEILNEFGKAPECRIKDLLSFEYVKSGSNVYEYSLVKQKKCAMAKFIEHDERQNKYYKEYVDQVVILNPYRSTFYTQLYRKYFKYRFPVFCNEIFYKESVESDYITLRRFIEERPEMLDKNVDYVWSVMKEGTLREIPCKKWKVQVYDCSMKTWLLFIETETKTAYVNVKALVDKDWDLLVETMKRYEGNGFMVDEVLESKEMKYLKQNWFEK